MQTEAYFLVEPSRPLVRRPFEVPPLAGDEVLVEVTACGLCHTDLSFARGEVSPRHDLPLVLGHEITGVVVRAGAQMEGLAGRPVLVPAVLPCGECALCRAGRTNICTRQRMPGNDIHGGFASHVVVPGRFLVPLDDAPAGFPIADLSVVADAVSTAYQAVRRAGLAADGLAVVVGSGGVGSFAIQIAKALGAQTVACDVAPQRLETATRHGADAVLDLSRGEPADHRKALRRMISEAGVPSLRHAVFECSGTTAGQALAFGVLGPAATMVQVGFTREKLSLRLSNLMAYDATVHGSWGCPPEVYPEVLELIYRGDVVIEPFIEHAGLDELNRALDDMAAHRLERRMVLHPNGRPAKETTT